jgi:hypothetical protein
VALFDGAPRPLAFACGPGRAAAPSRRSRPMGAHCPVERLHRPLPPRTVRDRTVVSIPRDRATPERAAGASLGQHRVAQQWPSRLDCLARGPVVFRIGHAAARGDDTGEPQREWPPRVIHPRQRLQGREIGGAALALPQLVTGWCRQAHRWWGAPPAPPIEPPGVQGVMDGALVPDGRWRLPPALGRLDPRAWLFVPNPRKCKISLGWPHATALGTCRAGMSG